MGLDNEVLKHVTSANIACGYHAGDPLVMNTTVKLAKEHDVAIGAHPGYPDLMGFGRRKMAVTPEEASAYMLYQVGALEAFAKAHGLTLQHMKLHGAFYNTACVDPKLANAIIDSIEAWNPDVYLMVLSGSYIAKEAKRRGLRVIEEVFADRGYTDEGTLVPRSEPGAFVNDPEEAVTRIIRMIKEGTVTSNTGKVIPITADSVCVHGDNPEAVAFAKAIREGLESEGIIVRHL